VSPAPARREVVDSAIIADHGIFRVRRTRSRSVDGGPVGTYHTLDAPDWVNVIAVTADGRLVMAEQYRHGTGEVTLEFPAGIVEEGEDGVAAGLRELEEETGYRAAASALLGRLRPNPAILSNTLWAVLAEGRTPAGEEDQDEGEDVHTRLIDPADVPALVRTGRITHALSIAVWHLYRDRQP
jgi:ADP-ribose pyrophosphatase